MKERPEQKPHPVDSYFQQQEERMPVAYNPENWMALEAMLDANLASPSTEEKPDRKAHRRSDNGLPFLLLLLALIGLGWWLFAPFSTGTLEGGQTNTFSSFDFEEYAESDGASAEFTERVYTTVAESARLNSLPTANSVEPDRVISALPVNRAIASLPSLPLPSKLVSIQPVRPLRIQVRDPSLGAQQELFIFW